MDLAWEIASTPIKDVLGTCFPMDFASRFLPEIFILVCVAQGRCFPTVLASRFSHIARDAEP